MSNATLNETDVRELAWVADVLEDGGPGYSTSPHLSRQELADLAGVVRSKLPAPKRGLSNTVEDKYGTRYQRFAGGWFYIEFNRETNKFEALRVPFSSIQEPRFIEELGVEVVE